MMVIGFRLITVFLPKVEFFIRVVSGYYGAGPLVEKLKSLGLSIRKFKS
tara:strand:- start:314 stop:460 length:147 start_codon:yes stop_codon:yes gene_type:complete